MRVLCIEDNPTVAAIVGSALRQTGYTVDVVTNGEDGISALAVVAYDAVVLDLSLPDTDGLLLLKQLRRGSNAVPVLILSGRNSTEERVAGLQAGSDDYLSKPFDVQELVARIRALLRRPARLAPAELRCGRVAFQPDCNAITVDGAETILPRREGSVLGHLLRNVGRPVPKALLEDRLYSFGEEIVSNAIEVHVHHLRKRLAALGADLRIDTIRGTGYVLRPHAPPENLRQAS